jgi:glycosyltransferase involved in cell wall biosynthesis
VDQRLPDDPEVCRELRAQRNLFFVGQISRHKGVDLLVQAFKIVAAKHPNVMLHLIGEGKEEFRATLQDEINVSGLQGRVKFWGYREDATRLLRFAYIYIHSSPPSRFHESFGRSVVEAMAHGVPVVCFRSGALQDIVLHEKTGLICEEGSESLAQALNRLLQHAECRDEFGESARGGFEKSYCKRAVLPRWQQFYAVV